MGITLARSRCAQCRSTTGLRLWPWSGRVFVTSHTLCARCMRRMHAAIAARRPLGQAL